MEKAIATMTANYLKAMSHPSRIKIMSDFHILEP